MTLHGRLFHHKKNRFLQSVFERVSVCFPELALTMAVNSNGSTEFIESTKLFLSFLFIHLLGFRGFFVVGCRSSPLEAPLLGAFFLPLFIAMTDARRQQQVSRATTNELRPARDSCEHGHLSLMNRIKAVYLTRSFLIAYMRVRYSLLHYLLLI